ncbi:hypothetical protein KPH14_006593 [Odynerus spinipes]|uniref:Ig-like domain-containing protein n=1 Tax=Odynerus spinipes TaxID=1348599 RepID=A0AAD9VRB7_9HYME|nr:hypothetical protein KPH14_006593 [Odynerus spinipes]
MSLYEIRNKVRRKDRRQENGVLTVSGYDVRVNRSPVVEGCNAVLSCTAREDIKEHLTVTSWFRDDAILLPGSTDTGESTNISRFTQR